MSILNPTHTIFKSHKISFEWDKETDNRYVKAVEDIFEGDLIFIEHALITEKLEDNYNLLVLNILYNENIFNQLYPRKKIYNVDDVINGKIDDEYIEAIIEKIEKNCFRTTNKNSDKIYHSLPIDFVNFNHSKEPNINYHHIVIDVPNLENPIYIFYVVCCKDILKGDELLINYGNNYFKEDTDLTQYMDKSQYCFKKNNKKIMKKINDYLESKECKDVLFNHHFFSNGLIYVNSINKYIGLPKFRKLLKDDENIDVSVGDMNEWIQKQMLMIYTTFKDKFKKIKPLKYIKDV
jgi:hypothetical protein